MPVNNANRTAETARPTAWRRGQVRRKPAAVPYATKKKMKNRLLFLLLLSCCTPDHRSQQRQGEDAQTPAAQTTPAQGLIAERVPRDTTEERNLLKTVFTDRSNFEIMTFYGAKVPPTLQVVTKPEPWNENRFWVKGIETLLRDSVKFNQARREEHNPYWAYLFVGQVNQWFDEADKAFLYRQSLATDTTHFDFTAEGTKLVAAAGKATQPYAIAVTRPLFTRNKRTALVELYMFSGGDMYAHNLVIYRKEPEGAWVKVFDKPAPIL